MSSVDRQPSVSRVRLGAVLVLAGVLGAAAALPPIFSIQGDVLRELDADLRVVTTDIVIQGAASVL